MNTVVNHPSAMAQTAPSKNAEDETAAPVHADSKPMPDHGYGYGNRSRTRTHATLSESTSPAKAATHSAFVPLLLGTLALLGWLGFQTQQLFNERQALQIGYASQQQTVDNAGKLRASLDALAADTQRMADAGNPNAKLLVDELRKRGITINAASASSSTSVPVMR